MHRNRTGENAWQSTESCDSGQGRYTEPYTTFKPENRNTTNRKVSKCVHSSKQASSTSSADP